MTAAAHLHRYQKHLPGLSQSVLQNIHHCTARHPEAWASPLLLQIPVDIALILGNLITVIFDYQILRKPLKILSL